MFNLSLPPLPEEEVDARLADMDRLGNRDYKEIARLVESLADRHLLALATPAFSRAEDLHPQGGA